MSNYVYTPLWGQTFLGATERYITPDVDPPAAQNLFTTLASMRMALLPTTAYLVGWRVSLYGPGRKSSIMRPGYDNFPPTNVVVNFPGNGAIPANAANGYPPLMQISMQVNVGFNNGSIARQYFAGIPNNVVSGQPTTYNPNGNVAWAKALANFDAWLVSSGFQIQAQNMPSGQPYKVTGLVPAATSGGNIGVAVSSTGTFPIVQGNTVFTQHFLPAKGTRNATMNGHWTVDSVNITSSTSAVVFLRGSAGIDPTQQRISQKTILFQKSPGLFRIQNMSRNQIVTHKRGKAGGALRGRRLIRPSLDP